MATSQARPNEIKNFTITADGKDISPMVLQTDIFQDVFMPTWSCQIGFADTQNLLMNLPIKPGTEISIHMETQYPVTESKTFKFVVYKISDRILLKQEQQGYVLHCVTKEFFNNQKQRVIKSYKTMSADAIVAAICAEYGVGSIEDSDSDSNAYSVIVPNMSPFGAISWVSRYALGSAGGADFIFYQSDTGKFKYKSLDSMLSDRSGIKFKQINPNITDGDANTPVENFLNIEHYEFLSQHDSMSNFAAGYYGSKIISHNIYDKKIDSFDFNFGDDIAADKTLKSFSGAYFENANDSHVVYQPISTNGMGLNITLPADNYEAWLGSRKTNIMKFEENRLLMAVPGAVSHYKILGKQVDVELPSHQDHDEGVYLDKYLKGSYVVLALRHSITTTAYKVSVECGKKRLDTPLA